MKFRAVPSILLAVAIAFSFPSATNAQVEPPGRGIDWSPYQDEAVKLLQEYLRIDTSNPPGNEMEAAEFFHKVFDQAGIANTVYPYGAGRANFYAVLKGDGTLRPLVMLNHMDVVRADPQNWKVAPFSA